MKLLAQMRIEDSSISPRQWVFLVNGRPVKRLERTDALVRSFLPAGWKNSAEGIDPRHPWAIYQGIPSREDVPIPRGGGGPNSLYVVYPSELARAGVWGNDLKQDHVDSILTGWQSGENMSPVTIEISTSGRLYIEDGNHRVHAAALSGDQPVVARFRAVGPSWVPQTGARDISDRIRKAIMKPNPSPGYVQNPPWVTKLIADTYVTLEEKVPAKWMPKLDHTAKVGAKTMKVRLPDYGCGAYGCVLPTLDPGVVLKVTSDESEADFAYKLAKTLPVPICVAYHLVLKLPNKERKGLPVFFLWREEAKNVGKLDEVVGHHADDAVAAQHEAAKQAFIAHVDQKPPRVVARAEDAWLQSLHEMARVPELEWLASGMERAYHAGVFITDVHAGNLGQVERNGAMTWAITDPGNVVVIGASESGGTARP